ncbi:MAG TPA: carboxylesterase family protein, partial [Microvirga sp.]|nr:carboxylesterase family protein [Microvirga sp.]
MSTASLGQPQEPLTVNTATGAVLGTMGNGIQSWLGIPHAAPPVGPLRWKPPQPATPWAMPVKANALPSSYVPAG